MGASREGFNLANRASRANFFRYLRRGTFQHLVWRDTLGPIYCWMVGHRSVYFTGDVVNGKREYACKTCCQYVQNPA